MIGKCDNCNKQNQELELLQQSDDLLGYKDMMICDNCSSKLFNLGD